jgi:hypothetical protein
MADAVIRGAKHAEIDGVEVRVKVALDAEADDLLWADGFILGTPENFAYMSGAISSIRPILTGLAVREVQEPVLVKGEFDEARLAECEELGLTMAAGLEAGVF